MDIKYLPQMPDESARRYLFVAIDRATRRVFVRTCKDQTERSSSAGKLREAFRFRLRAFGDRYTGRPGGWTQ